MKVKNQVLLMFGINVLATMMVLGLGRNSRHYGSCGDFFFESLVAAAIYATLAFFGLRSYFNMDSVVTDDEKRNMKLYSLYVFTALFTFPMLLRTFRFSWNKAYAFRSMEYRYALLAILGTLALIRLFKMMQTPAKKPDPKKEEKKDDKPKDSEKKELSDEEAGKLLKAATAAKQAEKKAKEEGADAIKQLKDAGHDLFGGGGGDKKPEPKKDEGKKDDSKGGEKKDDKKDEPKDAGGK